MPLTGSIGAQAPSYANQNGYNSISSTSLTISTGNKTITVQPGKSYTNGNTVKVYNSASNYMIGDVTSYNPADGTLNVTINTISGSGTYSSWVIGPSGPKGDKGDKGDNAGGNGYISVTTDTTILVNTGNVIVNMPGAGYYITLDDARNVPSLGSVIYNIVNISDFDVGVKNNTGTKLGWIRAGKQTVIGCSDKSTQAGVWSGEFVQHAITAVLGSGLLPSGSLDTGPCTKFDLDSNNEVIIYCYSGNSKALSYNKSTKTFGTIATIGSSMSSFVSGDTNQIVFVSTSGSNLVLGNLTVNTSTGNITTITQNVAISGTFAPTSTINGYNTTNITLDKIASNSYVATIATTAGVAYGVAFTVISNAISAGSVQTIGSSLDTSAGNLSYRRVYRISDTVFACLFIQTDRIRCNTFTLTGPTTITNNNVDSSVILSNLNNIKFGENPYNINQIPIFYTSTSLKFSVWNIPNDGISGISFSSIDVGSSVISGTNADYTAINDSTYIIASNGNLYIAQKSSSFSISITAINFSGSVGTISNIGSLNNIIISSYGNGSTVNYLYSPQLLCISTSSISAAPINYISTPANAYYMNIPKEVDLYGYRYNRALKNSKSEVFIIQGVSGNNPQYAFKIGNKSITPIDLIVPYGLKNTQSSRLDETWVFSPTSLIKVECA